MVKKIIMFLSMLFIKNLYGEFREVIPLENENIKKNIVTEKFEITKIKSENIKEKNSKMILGLEDRIGSIDVGKDADIVIWSKSPLELDANVEYTIIDGKIAYRK